MTESLLSLFYAFSCIIGIFYYHSVKQCYSFPTATATAKEQNELFPNAEHFFRNNGAHKRCLPFFLNTSSKTSVSDDEAERRSKQCEQYTHFGSARAYTIKPYFIHPLVADDNNNNETTIFHADEEGLIITLTSLLTVDRLNTLELMALHWSGPMSLAYYASNADAVRLATFVQNSPILRDRGNIAYHFVEIPKNSTYFPTNVLRNVALKYAGATSALVLTVDIDFLVRRGMYERLVQLYAQGELSQSKQSEKVAYVIPAFGAGANRSDVKSREAILKRFPADKDELLRWWSHTTENPRVYPFDNTHSFRPTHFMRWRHAKRPYAVQYKWQFEPTMIFAQQQDLLLSYDERFIGYGEDKTTLPAQMAQNGFQFIVLPFEFTVHIPHEPSLSHELEKTPEFLQCFCVVLESFERQYLQLNDTLRKP